MYLPANVIALRELLQRKFPEAHAARQEAKTTWHSGWPALILCNCLSGPLIALDDPAVVGLLGDGAIAPSLAKRLPLTCAWADDPPVLTAHGTKDLRVSFEHATLIDKALKQAGVTSLLIPLTSGHNFHSDELNRLFQYLEWQLRGIKADISTEPVLVAP